MLREVRPDDWRIWRDLRLRSLADAPDAFGEPLAVAQARDERGWQAFVDARPNAIRLFAESGRAPVGMIVGMTGQEHDDHRTCDVYAMWVAPEGRGRGVGEALVAAALRWARSRGALDVRLQVSDAAPAARRLYARCGFRDTGERLPVRDGSPVMTSVMRARLPPLIMGIVNVTPDSFTDGGAYLDPAAAIAHGEQLLAEGADILDIGGEATNPRATAVSAGEELRRVLPVIEGLAHVGRGVLGGPALSIDTTKAAVARAAVAAGVTIVNDISGGLFDPEMAAFVAQAGAGVTYVAGHLRGRSLREVFAAEGAVAWESVAAELGDRLHEVAPSRAWVDPGIGFGKGSDPEGNVALLRHAGDIAGKLGRPLVVGASRKRFLRRVLDSREEASTPTSDVLDAASVLASLAAVRAGAQVVRVHNVALLHTALTAYNKE